MNRRRRLHRWLIVLTAGLLALTIFGPWDWQDSLPESVAGGLHSAAGAVPLPWPDFTRLVDQWPVTFAILLGFLLLLVRSRSARDRMASELSAFWRARLPEPWDDFVYETVAAKPVVPEAEVTAGLPFVREVPAEPGAATILDLGPHATSEITAEEPSGGPTIDEQRRKAAMGARRTRAAR